MAKTLSDGSAQDVVLEMTSRDGTHRWLRVAGRAQLENGVPVKLLGATQDVTDEREAFLEREKLRQQLLHAQKMESVGRLAGGVAHDFNNVLSVILGHAELALDELPSHVPVAADLREIRLAAERSASLTRQLLAFARKQPIAPVLVNINVSIAETVNMLRRLIGERITLRWEAEPQLWDVFVDPTQIDQILANLCVNARDAIRGDGEVVITTSNCTLSADDAQHLDECSPGEFVMLRVSDNGEGIPSRLLEHVFEPFFTTKSVGAGTGLGLATVYGIVKQNHGAIRVDSHEGVGTTFEIFFPREIGHLEEVSSSVFVEDGGYTCNVLLVEDEPALLKLAARMLEGMGHNVFAAATPFEAIAIAKEEHAIDLLISDVIMPGMNGRELANELGQIRPGLRHIFMSGYTAEVMALEGVLDAGEFFLQKPFSLSELKRTVQSCLAT
ncbi:MAG: ATP-binding protein [bacterium]